MTTFTDSDSLKSVKCFGAKVEASPCNVEAFTIERHTPRDFDVVIDVKFCGICHSDVHFCDGDMGFGSWPMVPGHEIAGIVRWAGKDTEYKAGDRVGVGCMVDSCMDCASCDGDAEQYCQQGSVFTYGVPAKFGRACPDGEATQGGYSKVMVVHSRFVAPVPDSLPLEKVGPILCAGITMYDPLVHWKAGSEEGQRRRVGIIGGGGLGMMGIKIAKAMGCEVTAVTRSTTKVEELKAMGADKVLVSSDAEGMKEGAKSLDLILDTVSASHPINEEVGLLANGGQLVLLGLVTAPVELSTMPLLFGRMSVAGSCIGGMKNTRDVLVFCAKHDILPDTQLINGSSEEINGVYKTLRAGTAGLKRYVIDVANM